MKIGLLLPSVLMYNQWSKEKIFAPKELFLNLANGLVSRGHSVRVYSSEDTKTHGELIFGDSILALEEPPAMKTRYVEEELKKTLARKDARMEYELDLTAKAFSDASKGIIDIIHSFLEFSAHYFNEVTQIPTVYTLHDTLPKKEYLDWWRFNRFPSHSYVAISNSQARELRTIINKIEDVVYHGINLKEYEFSSSQGDYLFFMGRYMQEKGLDDAIKVAIQINFSLVIAGSKEYEEIAFFKQVIAPLLSNNIVKQKEYLDSSAKINMIKNARAFLFPIKWEEPFGLVMVEAMACGTPVIAYNRGSVSEIVRDGLTGFIVDPDNEERPGKGTWIIKKQGIEGLVEAVRRIGEIDRAACRKHVEKNFTVEKMVEGYEKVYQKVLSSH